MLATAPTTGLLTGGWLVSDVLGGRLGRQRPVVLRACAYPTCVSLLLGVLASYLDFSARISVFMWLMLVLFSYLPQWAHLLRSPPLPVLVSGSGMA